MRAAKQVSCSCVSALELHMPLTIHVHGFVKIHRRAVIHACSTGHVFGKINVDFHVAINRGLS